jgi:hypothetical protein
VCGNTLNIQCDAFPPAEFVADLGGTTYAVKALDRPLQYKSRSKAPLLPKEERSFQFTGP